MIQKIPSFRSAPVLIRRDKAVVIKEIDESIGVEVRVANGRTGLIRGHESVIVEEIDEAVVGDINSTTELSENRLDLDACLLPCTDRGVVRSLDEEEKWTKLFEDIVIKRAAQ